MDKRRNNACFKCCQGCWVMHRNKNDDSSPSFFKIMFGKKFDRLLFMPPKFSEVVKTLVGKKLTLEDSKQRKWDVKLSDVDGSLAFQKGWRNFVLDHDIEMGDLLVFHYMKLGHFLVEVFGKSGCSKNSNDRHRTTKISIPMKHPSDTYEQPSNNRYWDFPSSERVKEPPVMARNVPTRVHIRERSPTAVPLVDTHMDSCFMTSPEKGMPNFGQVAETPVDPCFMTNRDENRPKDIPLYEALVDPWLSTNTAKVIPGADTLVEPCFMTTRDSSFIEVDDGNRLFDLSAFEMRDKKSTTDMEKGTHYPLDLPVYDLPENETDANETVKLQKTETGITDKKSVINQDVEDYLPDSVNFPTCKIFERSTKEVLSETCKTELLRVECAPLSSSSPKVDMTIDSKVIGKQETPEFSALSGEKMGLNNQETRVYSQELCGDAEGESSLGNNSVLNSGDLSGNFGRVKQESTAVRQDICGDAMVYSYAKEMLRLDRPPLSSTPPKVDLPIDSITPLKIIGKPETSDISAVSDRKRRLNNQETKPYNQEFCGGECKSSLGTKFSTGKVNFGDVGGTIILIEQEPRHVKHDIICGDAMVSSNFDGIISTSDHTNFSCDDLAENSKPVMKIEANVHPIAMLEPADCKASFAVDVEVICSVSPDSEIFLELPDPLPVAANVYRNRVIKHKHQLVFLRDHAGRLWPVIYHQKNSFKALTSGWTEFMKAYNVQPGDKCIFTAEKMEGTTLTVQIVRHD